MLNPGARGELLRVAKRMVWFKTPEEALAEPALFVSHAMTYGTVDDLRVVRTHYTDDQLRRALRSGPPGIFDGRSGVLACAARRGAGAGPARQTPVTG